MKYLWSKLWVLPLMFLLLLSLASAVAVAPDPLDSVSYWKLEDLTDELSTYPLTNNGATSGATGIIDDAYDFDGSTDYMSAGSIPIVQDFTDDVICVSAWAKADTTGGTLTYIFGSGGAVATGQNGISLSVSTSGLNARARTDDHKYVPSNVGSFSTGSFHHVVLSVDDTGSGELKLWLDGTLIKTESAQAELGSTTHPFIIGARADLSSGSEFDGVIDEVFIQNAICDQDIVDYLYNSGSPTSLQQYPFGGGEVLTTNITSIYLNPNGTVYEDEANLKGVVGLNQTSGIYLNYTYYVNDVSVVTGQDTTPTSSNDLPVLNPSNFVHRDEIIVEALAVNSSNTSQRLSLPRNSSTLIIANYGPVVTASLSPLTALNTTDIMSYCAISDADPGENMNISWKIINNTDTFSSGALLNQLDGTYNVANISNSATNVGDNFSVECNVTDGFLTDTDTSPILTITDILNFTVSATNEWSGALINNFSIYVDNGNYCYQETANISTFCGGLNTGVYFIDNPYFYINYTIPNYVSSAIWLVKHGNVFGGGAYPAYNISIPNSCFENSDILQLRINNADGNTQPQCFSGSWVNIGLLRTGSSANQGNLASQDVWWDGLWGTYGHFLGSGNALYTGSQSGAEAIRFYEEAIYWYGFSLNTTTGGIITPIISNETANITVFSDDYFNRTYKNWNLSENLAAELYQSVINFTSTTINTNQTVDGVTYTIDGVTNTTFRLSTGSHTVIADWNESIYDLNYTFNVTALDNKTINVEGLYNTLFNFTAHDFITNNTINNFTVLSSYASNSTTNTFLTIRGLQNTSTLFNVSSSGFATNRNLALTSNSSINLFNITMYRFNSVNLWIRDAETLNLINQLVNVFVIDNTSSYINTTTNGFMLLELLMPQSYELRFESENYTIISKFLTVTNDSTQNVTVYMDGNQTVVAQRLRVVDTANDPVEGAVVRVQKQILNHTENFITVQESNTDSDGYTYVWIEKNPSIFYRFAVIVDGEPKPIQPNNNFFTTKTSFASDFDEEIQIVVDLEEAQDSGLEAIRNLIHNVTYSGVNNEIITFKWIDGLSLITGARLTVTGQYLNVSLSEDTLFNTTVNDFDGTITYTLPVTNNTKYTIKAYILYSDSDSLVWEDIRIFGGDVIINRSTGLFLAIIVMLTIALLTIQLRPMISLMLTFAILYPLSYLQIISISVTIISSLIAFVVIAFIKTKRTG